MRKKDNLFGHKIAKSNFVGKKKSKFTLKIENLIESNRGLSESLHP